MPNIARLAWTGRAVLSRERPCRTSPCLLHLAYLLKDRTHTASHRQPCNSLYRLNDHRQTAPFRPRFAVPSRAIHHSHATYPASTALPNQTLPRHNAHKRDFRDHPRLALAALLTMPDSAAPDPALPRRPRCASPCHALPFQDWPYSASHTFPSASQRFPALTLQTAPKRPPT